MSWPWWYVCLLRPSCGFDMGLQQVFSKGGKLSDPANVSFPGGLYDTGAPDERTGPFDAGASPGKRRGLFKTGRY
jgi:hypothetical protein